MSLRVSWGGNQEAGIRGVKEGRKHCFQSECQSAGSCLQKKDVTWLGHIPWFKVLCLISHDAEEINALKYLNVSYQGSVGSNDQVISAYCKRILRSGNSMMYESRQFWTEAFGFDSSSQAIGQTTKEGIRSYFPLSKR